MRFPAKLCAIALAVAIVLTGCGGNRQTGEAAKPDSAPTQTPVYAPPEGTFLIKAQKPEIRSYGNMTEYTFLGANKHGFLCCTLASSPSQPPEAAPLHPSALINTNVLTPICRVLPLPAKTSRKALTPDAN